MDLKKWIDEHQDWFIEASDKIWSFAEIFFEEEKSAEFLSGFLEEHGFQVERGIAGIPTAFVASYGSGRPVIAILGEYDALPGLSQDRVPYRKPLVPNGPGHGCQHNLLGVAGLAGAMAVKEYLKEKKIPGTIRYYGCPAEEAGSGKAFMAKAGVFDDVDVALCWHPATVSAVWSVNVLAVYSVKFRFHGVAAHAAGDPEHGRSALDAVELMNVGANYLREHIPSNARLHYVITNGGGQPNVVPAEAEVWYYVRAPTTPEVDEIYQRLVNIAKGAALMTGTEVEIRFQEGASNLLMNRTLEKIIYKHLKEIGAPKFGEKEIEFAREIRKTLPENASFAEMMKMMKLFGIPEEFISQLEGKDLIDVVLPYKPSDMVMPGSSDVGDVSWVTPTAQFVLTTQAVGTPGHSWQAVAQGGMSIGHKGMLTAAKIFATTAVDLIEHPELVKEVRQEFEEKIKKTPYKSPIPDGLVPEKILERQKQKEQG